MDNSLDEWLAIAQRQWIRAQQPDPHPYQDIAMQKSASIAEAILVVTFQSERENENAYHSADQ